MTTKQKAVSTAAMEPDGLASLIEQYGCGPVEFAGTDEALYERHLLFDNVVKLTAAGPRERFEAVARSVRDVLSQRWLLTEDTYERENPKRVYYLSMEFLIGRCAGQQCDEPLARSPSPGKPSSRRTSIGSACLRQNPTPALATAGSGAWPPVSSTRWPRCNFPPWATVCGTNTASFVRRSRTAGSTSSPTTGSAGRIPGRSLARTRRWKSSWAAPSSCAAATCDPSSDRPSTLFGIPFDRPVVGYGGKTINTLRLWAAAAPDYFDFQRFSSGDFVGAQAETLTAESLTRVLYPDDSTSMGQGLRFVQEYFLVACSLADLVRRFRRNNADWNTLPEKVAIQLNDTHPTMAVPELMRILLDEAHLGWDQAWDADPADSRLHEPHLAAGGPGEMAGRLV